MSEIRRSERYSLEAILSKLNQVLVLMDKHHGEYMSTVNDLQTTDSAILAAVAAATTNTAQLLTDQNAVIASLKAQEGPVTQEQLDAVVTTNNTILANLATLNSTLTSADAVIAPAAPVAATEAAPVAPVSA
jgi:hypothetical protein